MNTTTDPNRNASAAQRLEIMDMPLKVLVIPVSDPGEAKDFYSRLGSRLDADCAVDAFRLVQFTRPARGARS
jgi:hypothetical protein